MEENVMPAQKFANLVYKGFGLRIEWCPYGISIFHIFGKELMVDDDWCMEKVHELLDRELEKVLSGLNSLYMEGLTNIWAHMEVEWREKKKK